MPRTRRPGSLLLLLGALVLAVGVIAQLATTDGLAQTLWVLVSIAGAVLVVVGIVRIVRSYGPPEE